MTAVPKIADLEFTDSTNGQYQSVRIPLDVTDGWVDVLIDKAIPLRWMIRLAVNGKLVEEIAARDDVSRQKALGKLIRKGDRHER